MKKLFFMLILLFIIYFGIEYIFEAFSKGGTKNYEITDENVKIKVQETSSLNRKGEEDSYYWILDAGNTKLPFQLYQEFKRKSEVITNIKYYKDNTYECFLPIFVGNKILSDVMCINGNTIHYYYDLKGKSPELDQFVATLTSVGYKADHWVDQKGNAQKEQQSSPLTGYIDNLIEDHYVGVTTYRGISLLGKFVSTFKIRSTELFNVDVYSRPISTILGKYYLTADYSLQYSFSRFYIVDITTGKKSELTYHTKLSFDSYVQGSVKNSVYIFDNENKKQYEIDLKNEKIIECGNEETGIKYYENGNWSTKNTSEAVHKNLKFVTQTTSDYQNSNYVRIDQVGKDRGYYYLYKQVGNRYEVYRADVQNKEIITYLFTTDHIEQIDYVKDYVYYRDGNDLKYFHVTKGNRTVFTDTELEFNNNIFYNVYQK